MVRLPKRPGQHAGEPGRSGTQRRGFESLSSMTFHANLGLRLYRFDVFSPYTGLAHALFCRQGGVSPSPWESLNVGGGVGDEAARVVENRQRALRAAGRPLASIAHVWQVHSAEVLVMGALR